MKNWGDTSMQNIMVLREKLHKAIETGIYDEILDISRELDTEILKYMCDEQAKKRTRQ